MKNEQKIKSVLNKENTKVLNVIVKNENITATGIQKKLRWAFTPTRALGFLRKNKFVLVSKDKGYTISAKGTQALAGTIKPKRVKATPAPVVEAEVPAPVVNAEPELAAV